MLSYLPGQRLSRCTCSGESHPGPVHEDGTYVGRSAPEIDMFEAQVEGDSLEDNYGAVSQSGQWGVSMHYDFTRHWPNLFGIYIAFQLSVPVHQQLGHILY